MRPYLEVNVHCFRCNDHTAWDVRIPNGTNAEKYLRVCKRCGSWWGWRAQGREMYISDERPDWYDDPF
jgi:hypothetical protein